MAEILCDSGYTLLTAKDGTQAISVAQSVPALDLLLVIEAMSWCSEDPDRPISSDSETVHAGRARKFPADPCRTLRLRGIAYA